MGNCHYNPLIECAVNQSCRHRVRDMWRDKVDRELRSELDAMMNRFPLLLTNQELLKEIRYALIRAYELEWWVK